jgi:hypothetical protein
MGLLDKAKEAAAQQQAVRVQSVQAARAVVGACPGDHYLTEVNRGSINMGRWQSHLNDMYRDGYRLAHVLEQDGNTVQVYEHHFH